MDNVTLTLIYKIVIFNNKNYKYLTQNFKYPSSPDIVLFLFIKQGAT